MKGAIQKTPRSDGLLQTLLTHSADLAEIENCLVVSGERLFDRFVFYRKRLHQTAERTARRLFFDPFTEYLAFSPIFIYDVMW